MHIDSDPSCVIDITLDMPVESGRGCPYGCKFSAVSGFFGDSIRFRANESVVIDDSIQGAVFMKDQKFKIECGRCGETMSETLTGEEARTIHHGVGPVYRHCVRCERTTGWVEAAARRNAKEKLKRRTAGARAPSGSSNDRFVAHGQERLATASERDEVDAMLYKPDVVQNTK
ncbi:MAG: hypothetical protein MOB07_06295 [Acidobacteria bacterium]|nr:hypothetical protein [Acidobacteriota bacterium]